MNNEEKIKQAAEILSKAKNIVGFTGAGTSAESGIPPFRGECGIWNQYDPNSLDIDFYYRHTKEEESHRTIALFSHGGSSAAAMGHILNIPFPYMCALFHLEFTGITTIRFDRHEGPCTLPCLELGNDGRHIKEGKYHRLENR